MAAPQQGLETSTQLPPGSAVQSRSSRQLPSMHWADLRPSAPAGTHTSWGPAQSLSVAQASLVQTFVGTTMPPMQAGWTGPTTHRALEPSPRQSLVLQHSPLGFE